MKRIRQICGMTFVTLLLVCLLTMPFILEIAADNWSDCDGNGSGYKYSFNACVDARKSAYDTCVAWYHFQKHWWKCIFIDCSIFAARCETANALADDMCACDS